jgi:hypothetical protein
VLQAEIAAALGYSRLSAILLPFRCCPCQLLPRCCITLIAVAPSHACSMAPELVDKPALSFAKVTRKRTYKVGDASRVLWHVSSSVHVTLWSQCHGTDMCRESLVLFCKSSLVSAAEHCLSLMLMLLNILCLLC